MARPDEHDRESIDRAFAEMMASYHLTADRPEVPAVTTEDAATGTEPDRSPSQPVDSSWADAHPLFVHESQERVADEPEAEERFVPEEPRPLPKPAWPVLIAWLGLGYSILVMLAAVLGIVVSGWAGWLALVGFVGGMGLLFSRLPRSRPPDAGDGAVL
ncbi:MAG: hypothetical protein AVDCRST_MAG75-990 [uncultured Propionibacteriaceae bacterium]|uniref:Uncharacterized protein n=1 Tax=uncultured Propionibacteriaceae bacterium TaxID=257457 RepID=A0A6J4NBR4_9ACTN|nr:MAG: hypothetical protein AVDCRST_MAG75-990 [uncultured Propionibacteriaceae bacterium]